VLEAMWHAEKMKKKQEAGEESDSDDDEAQSQRLDEDRLCHIKTLLFDIHRVSTGEDKVHIP